MRIYLVIIIPVVLGLTEIKNYQTKDKYVWSSCNKREDIAIIFYNIIIINPTENQSPIYLPQGYNNYPILKIENSLIYTITSSFFKEYSSARELDIQNLTISNIIPGAFTGMHGINCLDISRNNLSIIGEGIFNGLSNLQFLNLSNNNIQRISSHAFKGVTNLNQLYLQENKISILDNNLFLSQKFSMEILNISNNSLREINDTFRNMTLHNLYLNFNEIGKIDLEKIGTRCIYLSNNKITYLRTAGNITDVLDISRNMIKEMDEDFFVASLTHINISHNYIENIEKKLFSGLHNLTHLHLEFNNLSVIPVTTFRDLKSLTYLDISHNNILELQYGTFDNVKNLQSLNLSYNKFKNFQQYILSPLINLEELYVNHNNIRNINIFELMGHCIRLITINIDGNFLSCKQLAKMIKAFESRGKVINGNELESHNVRGIKCSYEDEEAETAETAINNIPKTESTELDKSILYKLFNEDFRKTYMYEYFNEGFKDSNFYKYLEELKKPQLVVAKTDSLNETSVQKWISSLETDNMNTKENDAIYIILSINVFAFIAMLFLILFIIYNKRRNNPNNETVELM